MDNILHAYNPELFRERAHKLVDILANHLSQALSGNRSVLDWKEPEIRQRFWEDQLTQKSSSFEELTHLILDQSISLLHPGYMGHQNAPPLPTAALADLLVSVINSSSAIYEMGSATTMIEMAVVQWLCKKIGFVNGIGHFTSGGSLANLTALLAARQNAITTHGLSGKNLGIMTSAFSHYSVKRAGHIMGLRKDAIIELPVDEFFRVDPTHLENRLAQAQEKGIHVFALVSSSCNTAIGTHDPLVPIADFCRRHSLWHHVDAAHGASALLSPKYRPLLQGIEEADSVVWDAHKMLMMPALTSAVLFKNPMTSFNTFDTEASYLFASTSQKEWFNTAHRTLECTKRAFALRLFFGIYFHEALFGEYVTAQYDLAKQFAECIHNDPLFELALMPESNIVCFRFREPEKAPSNELQSYLRKMVIKSGKYYLVQTNLDHGTLHGTFLRTTLMNPGTKTSHLLGLLDLIKAIAIRSTQTL